MSLTIYLDDHASAIFFEDANGAQFLNTLQATSDPGTTVVSVTDTARDIEIVSDLPFGDFVGENGDAYGANATEVCNALNAVFSRTGVVGGGAPTITSNLTANLVAGQTFNYELTATNIVGVEWDLSNVPGITQVEGNPRMLVGGSGLSVGTYNIPVKAINYYGEDSRTLVLTVGSVGFANSKSVSFSHNDYLTGTASNLSSVLGRAANGAGSGDAWSIQFWIKPSTASNSSQTILYFGDTDVTNSHHIRVLFLGNDDKIRLQYGSSNNYLRLTTTSNSVPAGSWTHVLITYDGGTTGSSSGDISSYYGRFSIWLDGAQNSTNNANGNYGISTGLDSDVFRVARYDSSGYLLTDTRLDELAIWDSDESSNITAIYNSGTPHDLSALGSAPSHWWRMGDGDTFPTLTDSGTGTQTDLAMTNMSVSQIVSDVP